MCPERFPPNNCQEERAEQRGATTAEATWTGPPRRSWIENTGLAGSVWLRAGGARWAPGAGLLTPCRGLEGCRTGPERWNSPACQRLGGSSATLLHVPPARLSAVRGVFDERQGPCQPGGASKPSHSGAPGF